METYKIWEGTRTFLPGDASEYKVIEITGEELGMFEDADYDSGRTYYVYQTEGEIIIHLVNWKSGIGEPHYGSIYRFSSLEEAAQNDELRQALKDMRLI
jgi:hypothetical protein